MAISHDGGKTRLALTNFADVVGPVNVHHGKPVPLHPKDKDGSKFGHKVGRREPTLCVVCCV